MARGDVLLVGLPATGKREQSGRRPAVAVQTDMQGDADNSSCDIEYEGLALSFHCKSGTVT